MPPTTKTPETPEAPASAEMNEDALAGLGANFMAQATRQVRTDLGAKVALIAQGCREVQEMLGIADHEVAELAASNPAPVTRGRGRPRKSVSSSTGTSTPRGKNNPRGCLTHAIILSLRTATEPLITARIAENIVAMGPFNVPTQKDPNETAVADYSGKEAKILGVSMSTKWGAVEETGYVVFSGDKGKLVALTASGKRHAEMLHGLQ